MKSTCSYCSKTIVGRSDKRFCNSSCRTHYHNERNKLSAPLLNANLKRIKKNYIILSQLINSGKAKVSKASLDSQGFAFGFCSQALACGSGKVRYYCGKYYYEVLTPIYLKIGVEEL